ncbi:MAG TPA: hypothetical protein VH281_09345 [Gaiellaceae bacterium]
MALIRRGTDDTAVAHEEARREETDVRGGWGGPPLVRALFTLLGVAVAGFLLWVAQLPDASTTNGFWSAMGIIAGAGLVLGISQLLGGWTKWGLPHLSPGVFLFAWVPTAIVVGWVMMVVQPENGWYQDKLQSWSSSIGVEDFVRELGTWPGALALGLGIVTAFTFDTTGPRVAESREVVERAVPDEDVHDYERPDVVVSGTPESTSADEPTMVTAGEPRTERIETTDPKRRDTP